MGQRTEIPCAGCQSSLELPHDKHEVLACPSCGLEGPMATMTVLAEMRGLMHGAAAVMRDRRMRSDTLELTVQGCNRLGCLVKASEIVLSAEAGCICAREDVASALRVREMQVDALRGTDA